VGTSFAWPELTRTKIGWLLRLVVLGLLVGSKRTGIRRPGRCSWCFRFLGAVLLVGGLSTRLDAAGSRPGWSSWEPSSARFIIWWTIVATFVALAVVVLTILWMRRPPLAVT